MTGLVTAVRAMLGVPGLDNVDGHIHLLVPVVNGGEAALSGVEVRDVKLGAAARVSPVVFPVVLGMLDAGSAANVTLRFAAAGLAVGQRCLLSLTVACTTVRGGGVHAATLTRYVRIPAPSRPPAAALHARVATTLAQNTWRYTVFNEEAPDSGLYVSALALMVSAPVAITGTPPGWRGETDGNSYVFWRAADYLPPYPNHLLPGQALSGFELASTRTVSQASSAALSSWNHSADTAGPRLTEYVLTPYRA